MSRVQLQYPLSGITVIDLSHFYNGPYATFLMAMAGAYVIKVEPFQGEHLRSRGDTGGPAAVRQLRYSVEQVEERPGPVPCMAQVLMRIPGWLAGMHV